LYALKDATPKLRRAIIENAENSLINTINEIAYNTLHKNNPINSKTKKYLKLYKREMRCLACPKRSLSSKRTLLIQRGGFLPVLIGSVLSGIIGKLLEDNI